MRVSSGKGGACALALAAALAATALPASGAGPDHDAAAARDGTATIAAAPDGERVDDENVNEPRADAQPPEGAEKAPSAPEVPVARLPEGISTEAARKAQEAAQQKREVAELCGLLMGAAERYSVPADFFIRLIWKESRFNAGAVSPVGAQGIAQFMPGTARIRGLEDPFDREEALYASASFLADIKADLGSWGLAAIGYNGGPNRAARLAREGGGLPAETIDYVFSITGRSYQYWGTLAQKPPAPRPLTLAEGGVRQGLGEAARVAMAGVEALGLASPEAAEAALQSRRARAVSAGRIPPALRVPLRRPDYTPEVDCPELVARLGRQRDIRPPSGLTQGATLFGAQVAGHPKRAVALAQYNRVKAQLPADITSAGPRIVVRRFAARGRLPIHAVQFPAGSVGEAKALCKRIAKALAPCVVVKNR